MDALAEEALRPALEALGDDELEDLLWLVGDGLRAAEEAKQRTFDLSPPAGLDKLAGDMSRDLDSLVKRAGEGRITQAQFDKQAHDLVSTNFRKAYEKGLGRELDAGDEEWLSRAAAEELNHARRFGKQAAADELRMPRGKRAEMYGQTLSGISLSAQVEDLPDSSRIGWILGKAEHCCLTSNLFTLITACGRIPLKDVRVGDLVLTHRGRWRRVLAKPVNRSTAAHRYAVLVGEGGRLVGLTDDHRLWTRAGWVAAREVSDAQEKVLSERDLSSVWWQVQQDNDALPEMLRQGSSRLCFATEKDLRQPDRYGFHVSCKDRKTVCGILDGRKVEARAQSQMGMGMYLRSYTGRVHYSSQESRSFRRLSGEFRIDCQGEAQSGAPSRCVGRGEESELERWQTRVGLRDVWQEVCGVCPQGGDGSVLFCRMSCTGKEGQSCSSVRSVRKEIREDTRKGTIGEEKWKQKSFVLSCLLSEDEARGGDDPVVRLLREEVQTLEVADREVQVGDVLLLTGVLEPGTCLYDLTVEEDHSFLVEGMAVSNSDCLVLAANSPYTKWNLPTVPKSGATRCLSNCKCKLTVTVGALSKEELADAAEYEFRKDQSLAEMMERPEPPKGLRWPNDAEQRHIDDLRHRINVNRRLIASGDLDKKALKDAIRARRDANDALIDFLEKNDVYDVPVWSVEDVLDERDIGRRAVKDIFRHGLDGKSLDKVEKRKLAALLDRYEREVGETFSQDALAAGLE